MLNGINFLLFSLSPVTLYFIAGLIMSVIVMPRIIKLYRQETEYKQVARLLLIIAFTMTGTATVGLLFLACYLFPCSVDADPYRNFVRLLFALNIFSASMGFAILVYLDEIKKWIRARRIK